MILAIALVLAPIVPSGGAIQAQAQAQAPAAPTCPETHYVCGSVCCPN